MYKPKRPTPALRFSNQHNYNLLWERKRCYSASHSSVLSDVHCSWQQRREKQLRCRTSSHLSFSWNCDPLHTDLGVSTTKTEVPERKLMSLSSTWLHNKTALTTTDLGVCTLNTQAESFCSRKALTSGWADAPEHAASAHDADLEKKAKMNIKERTPLSEASAPASYSDTGG